MDFALILFIALVLTGGVALWDRLVGSGKQTSSVPPNRSVVSGVGESKIKDKVNDNKEKEIEINQLKEKITFSEK